MIRLRFCDIALTDWGCETRFHDGTSIGAHPHDEPDYHLVSADCGNPGDILGFCRDHDAIHSLVAEWFFGAPSRILWELAHDRSASPSIAVQEEALVQTCRRWVRADKRPIIADADWYGFKRWSLGHLAAWS